MIELYYYTSPNPRKILIALEELSLPYSVRWVDLAAGEQNAPEFLAVNPNRKVPAIVDDDGPGGRPVKVFESGAVLLYLAEKTGRLLPVDPLLRMEALQWLFWQTSSQGPLLSQATHFFSLVAGRGIDVPYAVERFRREAVRLYAVLDRHLHGRDWVAGEFSIADISIFPWVHASRSQGVELSDYPNVVRWMNVFARRPSAQHKLPRESASRAAAPEHFADEGVWRRLFGGPAGSTVGPTS